jgi:hypothetical protein
MMGESGESSRGGPPPKPELVMGESGESSRGGELSVEQLERLRRSGIRLDADGRFWHEGAEVLHAGLRAALWRWLDRDPDGRWVLRLDERRFVYLDVDDAPHAVRSLRWEGERAIVRLADDTEEPLDPATLRLASSAVYCRVKRGRFEARLSPAAWTALGERIEERDGVIWLRAAGGPFKLGAA